jgi:hypothetical protein
LRAYFNGPLLLDRIDRLRWPGTTGAGSKEMQTVENEGIAKQISDLMVEFGGRLNGSVALVKENCGEAELQEYRRAVGAIMAEMLFRVMNPLYERHPGLKPEGLR